MTTYSTIVFIERWSLNRGWSLYTVILIIVSNSMIIIFYLQLYYLCRLVPIPLVDRNDLTLWATIIINNVTTNINYCLYTE